MMRLKMIVSYVAVSLLLPTLISSLHDGKFKLFNNPPASEARRGIYYNMTLKNVDPHILSQLCVCHYVTLSATSHQLYQQSVMGLD